jgi:hypothetical protein
VKPVAVAGAGVAPRAVAEAGRSEEVAEAVAGVEAEAVAGVEAAVAAGVEAAAAEEEAAAGEAAAAEPWPSLER